jgi:hypothetical protein
MEHSSDFGAGGQLANHAVFLQKVLLGYMWSNLLTHRLPRYLTFPLLYITAPFNGGRLGSPIQLCFSGNL